jgi:UDP-N-acetylglucosamine 1-carboxyvinyltransferase
MKKFIVNGGKPLNGSIEVSGMKNAALPVLFATILTEDVCVIENIPEIDDVTLTLDILRKMGARIKMLDATTAEIDTRKVSGGTAPFDLVRKMRASYYLVGAELGRFNKATVGLPGGCDFGIRPIDQHIKGFEALGSSVEITNGVIRAKADDEMHPAEIFFDVITVGGTINVMLAASRIPGLTIIENAAREPHIVDLANFLNTCGAKISGAGTDTIKIKGVSQLHGCNYAIIPDMIEAGTFMLAAAATKGSVEIKNVIPRHLESITAKLREMGVEVIEDDESVIVTYKKILKKINVKALPYPGFPTDMQPQMCVLMTLCNGTSILTDGVYDNRFKYVDELRRMNADISVDGRTAVIYGTDRLLPATVRAIDLRAGAAMVIAGLATEGETVIEDVHHIERGYDNIVGKLCALGADIKTVKYDD